VRERQYSGGGSKREEETDQRKAHAFALGRVSIGVRLTLHRLAVGQQLTAQAEWMLDVPD
jgi:hypothetical protein